MDCHPSRVRRKCHNCNTKISPTMEGETYIKCQGCLIADKASEDRPCLIDKHAREKGTGFLVAGD